MKKTMLKEVVVATDPSVVAAISSRQASNSHSDRVTTGSGQVSITTLNSDPPPSISSRSMHLYCHCQQPRGSVEMIGYDYPH